MSHTSTLTRSSLSSTAPITCLTYLTSISSHLPEVHTSRTLLSHYVNRHFYPYPITFTRLRHHEEKEVDLQQSKEQIQQLVETSHIMSILNTQTKQAFFHHVAIHLNTRQMHHVYVDFSLGLLPSGLIIPSISFHTSILTFS